MVAWRRMACLDNRGAVGVCFLPRCPPAAATAPSYLLRLTSMTEVFFAPLPLASLFWFLSSPSSLPTRHVHDPTHPKAFTNQQHIIYPSLQPRMFCFHGLIFVFLAMILLFISLGFLLPTLQHTRVIRGLFDMTLLSYASGRVVCSLFHLWAILHYIHDRVSDGFQD